MEQSKLWLLNHRDMIKGGIVFVISSVLALIYSALKDKAQIDWMLVANTALLSTITYILKQLGTDSEGKFLGKI